MENKLKNYFFIVLGVVVLFVTLYAVLGPQGKNINLKEINFKTTESSELYFKNIRSYFYDKENRDDAQFILYRLDSRTLDTTLNKLNFILVSNWLLDECYIIAASNQTTIKIAWENKKDSGKIFLTEMDSEANYIFAALLFEKLSEKATLSIVADNNEQIPFTEKEKVSLKTSLKDYFKLVGKLR